MAKNHIGDLTDREFRVIQDAFQCEFLYDHAPGVFNASRGAVCVYAECVSKEPRINYDSFCAIADEFETSKIDIDSWGTEDGCPTCDYGRKYRFRLTITVPANVAKKRTSQWKWAAGLKG